MPCQGLSFFLPMRRLYCMGTSATWAPLATALASMSTSMSKWRASGWERAGALSVLRPLACWRGVWVGALSAALSGFFDYSGRRGLRLPRLFAVAVCAVGGRGGLGFGGLSGYPPWRVLVGGGWGLHLWAWGYWPSFWSISSIGRAGVAMVISLTSLGMYLKAEYAVCRS